MAVRESANARGDRRSRELRQRLAESISEARVAAGLSLREVARRVGVHVDTLIRLEAADSTTMTVDLVARVAAVLGLKLAASLYVDGDPVRDEGHLKLLARFRARLGPGLRVQAEAPMPISGDPRSGDALVGTEEWSALVEAETRVGDVQLVERRAAAKQRDLGADRLILLVADTGHNREVLRLHPELRERFPIDARTCLRRLGQSLDPGGDALVIL
ncbi:MAG TPA: helix-turn-helix transcriptional regulator [Candidatus Binatia bacterium]|nr:helix-turn-helix transcriptional regulator [Candidatus Binatia bacterium]